MHHFKLNMYSLVNCSFGFVKRILKIVLIQNYVHVRITLILEIRLISIKNDFFAWHSLYFEQPMRTLSFNPNAKRLLENENCLLFCCIIFYNHVWNMKFQNNGYSLLIFVNAVIKPTCFIHIVPQRNY